MVPGSAPQTNRPAIGGGSVDSTRRGRLPLRFRRPPRWRRGRRKLIPRCSGERIRGLLSLKPDGGPKIPFGAGQRLPRRATFADTNQAGPIQL